MLRTRKRRRIGGDQEVVDGKEVICREPQLHYYQQ